MKTIESPSPALKDFTALFNVLAHASEDAIIAIDNNGSIHSWNTAATSLFGYTAAEALANNISVLLECPFEALTALISDKEAHRPVNMVCTQKNGQPVNNLITVLPATGNSSLFLLIIKQEPAADSNAPAAHLKAIFDNAEEGFVLIDKDCVVKAFNYKARESVVLSYSENQLMVGHSLFDFVEDIRRPFFREMIDKVLSGRSTQYDRSYPGPDGQVLWYNFSLKPVREGDNITGICITGNDITKRKLAEERAEYNEKRFRGLVENSGDAVSILSADGTAQYVSPSTRKILGYTEEQALEMNLFSIIHPDDINAVKRVWEKILNRPGIPFHGNICRIKHAGGSWRWIDGTITNMLHDSAIGGVVDNFRDITSIIEAEQKLKASEERYRQLFYSNPLPMWIYDPATLDFLEVNNAAIEKYGYSRDEFKQLNLRDIRCGECIDRLQQAVLDRKDKKFNYGTWQHVTKDNRILQVEITSHPVQYEGIDAILVLSNDVTEKNEATQLLLKSYEEKTNIVESIKDGFLTVDANWIVTYWNGEAERMLGMPRENILGKNIWEVYAVAIPLKFYSENMRALRDKVIVNYEEFFEPLNLWVDVTAYPSEDGLSVFFKDVTDKKVQQERISAAKERYDMLAQATNDVIYEWDIVNDVNYWGEGFETLFGHLRTAGPMHTSTWLDNIHPDEVDAIVQRTIDAFANKETSLTRELRFRCADGSYKNVFDKLVILYNGNQQPVRIVGAMQDISGLKANEYAINELNRQLNIRAEQLSESNEELERFAYVASHDLQEPLRMVGSFLQLLQRRYQSQLDETANQYIDFAVDGAERMKRLILDLLEYSRVGTNKDILTTVAVADVVQTIMKNYSPEAVRFRIGLLPEIRANAMQVGQLLQNLIGNAIKYNKSPLAEVEVGCEDAGTHWQFSVKDNGIGIEKKFHDKVFVIFQRLHNRNQFSGTGIGLAICRKIVERHNGRIWIESEAGNGSTFLFTIKK